MVKEERSRWERSDRSPELRNRSGGAGGSVEFAEEGDVGGVVAADAAAVIGETEAASVVDALKAAGKGWAVAVECDGDGPGLGPSAVERGGDGPETLGEQCGVGAGEGPEDMAGDAVDREVAGDEVGEARGGGRE
jgi:hypothetical protein